MHLLLLSLYLPILQTLAIAHEPRAQSCTPNPHSTPYNISNTNPPTSLHITPSTPKQKLNPYATLLTIITTLPEICRMPPTDPFPAAQISFHHDDDTVSVTLASGMGACGSLTYDDACTTLQGLAGYLTGSNDFRGGDFQIAVAGMVVGSGKVRGL